MKNIYICICIKLKKRKRKFHALFFFTNATYFISSNYKKQLKGKTNLIKKEIRRKRNHRRNFFFNKL